VPKRTADVFKAAAANIVNVSRYPWFIQICLIPAASAAAIFVIAAAAFIDENGPALAYNKSYLLLD
jgi:hypothetical protein